MEFAVQNVVSFSFIDAYREVLRQIDVWGAMLCWIQQIVLSDFALHPSRKICTYNDQQY
jgi:hypothetical protein